MDLLLKYMPILIYLLISILLIFLIVFVYKLIKTVDKTNILLDDFNQKSQKLNSFFGIIETFVHPISKLSDMIIKNVTNFVVKAFEKNKGEVEENGEEW